MNSADLDSHSCLTFITGQAGLGVLCPASLACDLAQQGQARPGWPPDHSFPGFLIPWPTRPKPGLWPGSPRLSDQALAPVYPGLARLLMQGQQVAQICFSHLRSPRM